MATFQNAVQAQEPRAITKRELVELIELKNHLLQIGRLYLRKREELGMLLISGAAIDASLNVQELLELMLLG